MRLLCAWIAVALVGSESASPYADADQPHRAASGFVNPGVPHQRITAWESLWRSLRGDFRPARAPQGGYGAFAARWRAPLDAAQLAHPPADGAPQLVWLGHASVLLQVGGLNVLIDPQLSNHAGPLPWLSARRRVPAPIAPEALPRIDWVLITHNHYDHLDAPTLRRLLATSGQKPRFLVPLGLKKWFDNAGIEAVEELDWWDERALGAPNQRSTVRARFLPARHWSKRTLRDANRSLWGGWAIQWQQRPELSPWRFVHTGDTGHDAMLYPNIQQRLGGPIDLLALPIGAYEPRAFMRRHHVNPDEAVQLLQALQARQAFAMHWGSFELSHEPFDQPLHDLAQALQDHGLPDDCVWLLRQGEIKALPVAAHASAAPCAAPALTPPASGRAASAAAPR